MSQKTYKLKFKRDLSEEELRRIFGAHAIFVLQIYLSEHYHQVYFSTSERLYDKLKNDVAELLFED